MLKVKFKTQKKKIFSLFFFLATTLKLRENIFFKQNIKTPQLELITLIISF